MPTPPVPPRPPGAPLPPSASGTTPTLAARGIDAACLAALVARERQWFVDHNPASAKAAAVAHTHLMFGVPLHWMSDWSTPFALQIDAATGAHLQDADGHDLVDFCLGDTGAMFGHAPLPVVQALAQQSARGYTTMLSNPDAAVVSHLLAERFGLPKWQFAMTATDANRFVLRWVRAATGRKVLLVFNGC